MVSLKDVISSGFLLDDELVVSAKVRLAPSPQLRLHSVGDRLYYNGTSRTVESGTRLTHGALGVVAGPGEGEYWGEGLQLRFGGGETVSCYLGTLSRERPPPLPGGFALDDTVYFSGNSQAFTSGDRLEFGLRGTVVGPTRAAEGLTVLFDGNKGTVQVVLNQLSREPPQLPGGYNVGDHVYFSGRSEFFDDGDKLVPPSPPPHTQRRWGHLDRTPWPCQVHGQRGVVTGRVVGEDGEVAVKFPGNTESIDCYLSELSPDRPPPLPGGYSVGEQVYYTGGAEKKKNGDRLVYGARAVVAGPAGGDDYAGKGLALLFNGNKKSYDSLLTTLTRDPPRLPDRHRRGDRRYCREEGFSRDEPGEVAGPAMDDHVGNVP